MQPSVRWSSRRGSQAKACATGLNTQPSILLSNYRGDRSTLMGNSTATFLPPCRMTRQSRTVLPQTSQINWTASAWLGTASEIEWEWKMPAGRFPFARSFRRAIVTSLRLSSKRPAASLRFVKNKSETLPLESAANTPAPTSLGSLGFINRR